MTREELLDSLRSSVADERVRAAVAEVPRELFVAPSLEQFAYADRPLPIGGGQTISQPTLVAHMCELLELSDGEVVLDVGSGSG
jgi:protein-L-isoaspartate(D-aspartate) O-methyltransferase